MSSTSNLPFRRAIAEMAGYVPGMQPKESGYIKLNTNENPYPPSPKVVAEIDAGNGSLLRQYPDPASDRARRAAAAVFGFSTEQIIMANGSDEVLNNLIRAFVEPGEEVGYLEPSYSYYRTLADIQGATCTGYAISDSGELLDFPERFTGKLFFLTNPNAPLGIRYTPAWVEKFFERIESGILVVDEAYADFAPENCLDLVRKHRRIVVTRTLSKSYSLAGMRLGLAIADPEIIAALDKIRDHYNLDRLAQAAAAVALEDQEYLRAQSLKICRTRDRVRSELVGMGYEIPESCGNYLFAIPPDRNGERIFQGLNERKILVRFFSGERLRHGVRITVGTDEEMDRLVKALGELG